MTSSSQNPLLSLNFENPKDGFKHLKRLQADFDCVEALTKHHNAQAVPKAVVEALARSFRELASKIAQDETDEDSSSVNESSDSIIRASSAKPSEANLYTGDAGVRLISDVSDQNLSKQIRLVSNESNLMHQQPAKPLRLRHFKRFLATVIIIPTP